MRERKPGWIGEAAARAVHDLRHHREGADGPGADPRHQQQLGKVLRPAIGRRSQSAVQPSLDDVIRPDVVMRRQDQMGQECLRIRCGDTRRHPLNSDQLPDDVVRAHRAEQMELSIA
jgi:hypothetical protein